MKTEDLNELANNLRKTKEFDEIRLLCSENGISAEIAEAFIKGDQLLLAASVHQENLKELQGQTWEAVRAVIKPEGLMEDDMAAAAERIRLGELLPQIPDTGPARPMHTLEDVKKKLETELEIYRDGDSKYVIEKLLELCQEDKVLLEAIMLPHKSYDKAFQYFYQRSRTIGYRMPHGNMVYLDNDVAVKLSVEYFKKDDKAEVKKNEVQKPKPKPGKDKSANRSKNKPQQTKRNDKKVAATVNQAEEKKEPIPPILPEMKEQKPKAKLKAKEMDGQLSLFD